MKYLLYGANGYTAQLIIKESLKAGIAFVFQNKAILGALTLDMIAVLFGGTVAILSVFAQDILKVGSEGFGILNASISMGSIVTMFITTYIPINKNTGKKLLISIFIFGLSIIAFGLSSLFWVSILALFISATVFGWGKTGHRVVGYVAQQHLTKKASKLIDAILSDYSLEMSGNYLDFIRSDTNYRFMNSWHKIIYTCFFSCVS